MSSRGGGGWRDGDDAGKSSGQTFGSRFRKDQQALRVLRWRGYRFFWYSYDAIEPAHVHIFKDGAECKIWLHDLSVAFNHGHSSKALRALIEKTKEQQVHLLGVWNDQFGE